MTTTDIAEQMKDLSKRLEILSITMMDLAIDEDDLLWIHSTEAHGASKLLLTWAKEIVKK